MASLESILEDRLRPRRDAVVPLLFGPGERSPGFVALTKIEKGLKAVYRHASIIGKQFVDQYGGSPSTVERRLAEQENVFLVFFFISRGYGVRMEASEFIPKHRSRCLAFLGPETLRCYTDYFTTNDSSYEADILRHLPGNHIKPVDGNDIAALEQCNQVPTLIAKVLGAVDLLSLQ